MSRNEVNTTPYEQQNITYDSATINLTKTENAEAVCENSVNSYYFHRH